MDAQKMADMPKITKETKNKIRVDYEDKTPFWTRTKNKLLSSYFWTNVVWYFFRVLLMIGISYVILYDFLEKIARSFMGLEDFADVTVRLVPKHFTFDTYKYIFIENNYLEAFFTTLILALSCALLQMMVSCFVGYGLAKFKFKGNGLILILVVITMTIPHETLRFAFTKFFADFELFGMKSLGIPGIISLFRAGKALNLIDTFAPLLLISATGLAFKNGLYIFMMRQFFRGVPDELEESAYVDGSGTMRTFFKIIIPLSVPMMITVFLFSFSWQWTDEFYTRLFFPAGSKFTFMPHIMNLIPDSLKTDTAAKFLFEEAIKDTSAIMIILPLVIMYLFCQKYLVQGIERSGIVG